MTKVQKVQFRSVDDFLEYLPHNELKLVQLLRQVVHDVMPECQEKLAYNVPFYYRHTRICYIWPASVPWGNVQAAGVQLGFCNGHLLRDDSQYLEQGNRKQVYIKHFTDTSAVDANLLKAFLYEAVAVDEELKRLKRMPNP